MPSQEYSNKDKTYESPVKTAMRDDFSPPSQAEKFKRRRAENYNYLAGVKPFRQSPEEKKGSEKHHQRNLKRLQKNYPKVSAGIAKGKKRPTLALIGGLFRQMDPYVDWLFLLLFSFALLKDIVDMVFAAAGAAISGLTSWFPVAGQIVGTGSMAIGITISFVGDLMFLVLVVTVLVLVGSSLKNRGLGKYYLGVAMEFIAEALPVISWLPWTVIYVFILYLCVLYDRLMNEKEQKKAAT